MVDKSGCGFGLGLRPPLYKAAAEGKIAVDWFEVISENFMVDGGNPLRILDAVHERYPVALHGVSMNLGGSDPLDKQYLAELKLLISRVQAVRVSDHLCWTRQGGHHLHDLLPLPYTDEVVKHVSQRIGQVQDFLGRQILIENVSSYAEFTQSHMNEAAFLTSVAEKADCLILLDVNNIVVSAHNHGVDAREYLKSIPHKRVAQIHLAGHTINPPLLIDTHDHPVADPVWSLYAAAINRFGSVPTMIERDDNIPPLEELLAELDQARNIYRKENAA